MNNSHIAVFNELGPTHVHPTFSIVETLVRRGYRVTYVTLERYESELSALGAEVLCPPLYPGTYRSPLNSQYAGDIIDVAHRSLSRITSFYTDNVPDLVLHDAISYAGAVLAEKLGVPAISTSPQLAYNEETFGHPSKLKPNDHRQRWLHARNRIDEFLRNNGVPRSAVQLGKGKPIIYFYVSDLQLPHADPEQPSLYAGRCAPERRLLARWQSTHRLNRPAVLVSASTIYEQGPQYYRDCMQAILDLKGHAILSIGENNRAESLHPLPPNCEVVQDIPQLALMPRADLIIGMGGTATTMEAMYHGVPLLMVTPDYAEAQMYAENVQKHGLGIHLEHAQASVDTLKRRILQIYEGDALRARVKRMQAIVRRSAGGEEAVNWMEEYMERHQALRNTR